jgi:hypothetical protein
MILASRGQEGTNYYKEYVAKGKEVGRTGLNIILWGQCLFASPETPKLHDLSDGIGYHPQSHCQDDGNGQTSAFQHIEKHHVDSLTKERLYDQLV